MSAVLRNFLSLAFGRYTALAVGFAVTIILARALGVENYGEFITALGISELFAAMLDLGLTRILIKEGAADRGRVGAHLANILAIKAALALLVLGAMHFYALRLGWMSPAYQLVLLLSLCKIADGFQMMFDGVFQVFQRMEYSAFVLVAGRLGLLAAVLAGWATGSTLLYYGWLYFIVSGATALATIALASGRFVRPRRGSVTLRQTFGREGLFFAISSLLYTAGSRFDMLAAREFFGPEERGIYGAAARLMLVMQILPATLQTAVLPVIFDLGRNAREKLPAFFGAYLHRSMLLATIPLLMAVLFAGPLVHVLFGEAFVETARWLPWMAALLPLRFAVLAAGNLLTAIDRQWERTIWAATGVGTSVTLLFLLVPRMGIPGAIVALLSGETLMMALNLGATFRLGYRPAALPILRTLFAWLLASGILLIARILFAPNLLLALVLVFATSLSMLLVTRAADLEDLRRLTSFGRTRG